MSIEYRTATVQDETPPLAWGFAQGEACVVARGADPLGAVVFTQTQRRVVTEWQVRDHLVEGGLARGGAAALAELEAKLKASASGFLGDMDMGWVYPWPGGAPGLAPALGNDSLEPRWADAELACAAGPAWRGDDWWLALWRWLPDGRLRVYFQQAYLARVIERQAWDLLRADCEHEHAEANLCWAEAVMRDATLTVAQAGGAAWQLNGALHARVIASSIEGQQPSEQAYEAQLAAKLRARLGIEVNWQPEE